MTEEIICTAQGHKNKLAELKQNSDYYPEILQANYSTKFKIGMIERCFSTLVRIFRDNQWYTVHCVESCFLNTEDINAKLDQPAIISPTLFRLMNSVHKIQNFYVLTGKNEDIDKCQISEEERFKSQISKFI